VFLVERQKGQSKLSDLQKSKQNRRVTWREKRKHQDPEQQAWPQTQQHPNQWQLQQELT